MPYLLSIFSLLLLIISANASVLAQTQPKQITSVLIRCESIANAESYCQADTSQGVRLVRELSDHDCVEGRTFGFDRIGIWVKGGCAAEFEIGYHSTYLNNGSAVVTETLADHSFIVCESKANTRNYCVADIRYGVRLVRQLSRNDCIESKSWGYSKRGIWADHGCRGEFEVLSRPHQNGYGRPGPPPTGPGRILAHLICESIDNRTINCPTHIGRNRVELIRQISRKPCLAGQSWGVDRNNIWVSAGCRAEFAVVRARKPVLLTCESIDNRRQYCLAYTLYGVRMNRQHSRTACTEGQTWGYNDNAIWVDRGCRAEFLVE